MLEQLRTEVLEANLELQRRGLVLYTFGNASGIDRERGLVIIKPSGVPYDKLKVEDLVIVGLDGTRVEGDLNPSSDLPTHILLYQAFTAIGGVVHTHSEFATSWAQSGQPIPCYGTTQADYFRGDVPVTDPLTDKEIESAYERNTGEVILRRFQDLDPMAQPGVLVANHGPFVWGKTATEAAFNAVVVEYIARLAYRTELINPKSHQVSAALLRKHYERKHGPEAYYGQKQV
jgi:L-ribulose-5-phosphate 4-epimerase